VTDLPPQRAGTTATLYWRGECCIESLAERREELQRALENGLAVAIDVSDVSRIDTAGLQLLLAFMLDMRRNGLSATCIAPSEPLRAGARIAGITDLLGLGNT
jgi:phospholipid transport system transporter-binding protein